jgi:hypothetical protein
MPTGHFDRGPGSKWREAIRRRKQGQVKSIDPAETDPASLPDNPSIDEVDARVRQIWQRLSGPTVEPVFSNPMPKGARRLSYWRTEWTFAPEVES